MWWSTAEQLPHRRGGALAPLKTRGPRKNPWIQLLSTASLRMTALSVNMDTKQQLIKESIAYIEKHYQEPMSVSDIARALGTSTSYLSRIFKESTGETIIRTINHKRIEKAKIYLKDTDYKVYEVADILGFENVTYFSRFFKKHTGISPKEYKESWH